MRLFISYGRDETAGFARRVTEDLRRAGHGCWFDMDSIRGIPDWRRSLMEELLGCEWTVGFLSPHNMGPGDVRPQELAIANDLLHGCLTTVLLTPLGDWTVPVSAAHKHWVDMSEWREREGDGAWYEAKLGELVGRLDPGQAAAYSLETKALEEWLRPLDQTADINRLLKWHVERDGLVQRLEALRLGEADARLVWMTGEPGGGKSAFAAWITHAHVASVVGLNLCLQDLPQRCDAGRIVRTMAFMVARRVMDYRALLLAAMGRLDAAALDRADAATLFDVLLAQPLSHCFDGGRRGDRLLLVVDGLDEVMARRRKLRASEDGAAVAEKALGEIVEVLRRQADKLPEWVGLLVTGRMEEPAKSAFARWPHLEIGAAGAENDEDVAVYVRGWLGGTEAYRDRVDELTPGIVARARGNFLYVRMLREAHAHHGQRLEADALPRGLTGLYDEWFTSQFPDPNAYEREVAPLLSLILAADTAVPDEVLDEVMGWDRRGRARVLEGLGSLFRRGAEGWTAFHASLREWLLGEEVPARHVVELEAGRRALWGVMRGRVGRAVAAGEVVDGFVMRELPGQAGFLTGGAWAAWGAELAGEGGVYACFGGTIQRLQDGRAWGAVRDWCGVTERLGSAMGEAGSRLRRFVAVARGDLHVIFGDSGAALAEFRAGMAIAERLAGSDAGNAGWQRDLSVSHIKIGEVLVARGDLEGALAAFRGGMAIAERLAGSDAGNAGWQRDLSVSHSRIGDVLVARGELEGALAAFRAEMAIAERLAGSDAENAGWQRDLSVSHERIGVVLVARGELEGALAAFRAGMVIRERLAGADAGNAEWQRDLSVSHDRIGDVLVARGELEGALAAFRAGMAIRERLAGADAGNAEWQRDLSVSHDRIGDVLVARGELEGALAAFRAGMAIRERLAGADAKNAGWQRDLSVSHIKIGDVLVARGELEGALAAFRAGMAIGERLAGSDAGNAGWQRDLSVSHERIGDVLVARGDLEGALAAFRAGMVIRERLAGSDAGNAGWQRDLSVSHTKIGDVLVARGELEGALAAFRAGMVIRERLAGSDAGNAGWQRDLSVSHTKIGDVLVARGELEGALAAFRAGMAIAERLAGSDAGNAGWQRDLAISFGRVADVVIRMGRGDGVAVAERALGQARACVERFPGVPQMRGELAYYEGLVRRARGVGGVEGGSS